MFDIYYHPLYTTGIDKRSRFPRDRYRMIYDRLRKSDNSNNINFIRPKKVSIDFLYKIHQKNM